MTTKPAGEETSLVPARRAPAVPVGGAGMREWAEELVARARAEGVELTGESGLLTALVREVLETGLEVELSEHLGYEPYEPAGRGSGNSRNGGYAKTVRTEIGDVEVRMPRDRAGTFAPKTIPKHARRLDGLAANVISLYAKGLTTGDIQAYLAEIYGTEISRETISKITDRGAGTTGQGGRATAHRAADPRTESPARSRWTRLTAPQIRCHPTVQQTPTTTSPQNGQ